MIRRRLRAENEQGVALLLVILLMVLLGIAAVSLISLTSGDKTRSATAATRDGSYQAAEAGVDAYLAAVLENPDFARQYLAKGEASRTLSGTTVAGSADAITPWSGGLGWTYASKDVWRSSGDGYEYDLEVFPPTGSGDGTTRIVSTGRPAGSTDTTQWRAIETRIRPSSISDFQMLSNVSIGYGSGATTYGDIYVVGSNNILQHNGTSYGNLYADGRVTGNPNLIAPAKEYDSTTTPKISDVIKSPPSFSSFLTSLSDVKAAAQSGGIYLGPAGSTPDAWQLTFLSNGTVQVESCTKTVTGSGWRTTTANVWHVAPTCSPSAGYPTPVSVPSNGAIFSEQDVIVQGTLVGRVTVASAGNVVIGGNIDYADGNVLGLVAQDNIIVGSQVPTDVTWRAAVLAQSGRFESDPDSRSTTHGTMTFNGSTATANGGSMGLFQKRNYLYDSTLKYLPPPWFPKLGVAAYTVVLSHEIGP